MNSIIEGDSSQRFTPRLLIVVAVAVAWARILASTPFQGANDCSRWVTVRALVDEGTYVIGHRDHDEQTGGYTDRGIMTEPGWDTIDKVLRPDTDDFYSSKPPLLSTLVAGEYWLLKKVFGWSLTLHPWKVARVILLTFNGVPLLIYLVLLARLTDRLGTTAWGREYVLAAGGFATFLTTFAVTLNNHTVATTSALFALYPFLSIWPALGPGGRLQAVARKGMWRSALPFGGSGFFAGFTACTELPAALYAAALAGLLVLRAPWRTLGFFLPAAAVPVAGFLVTNYLAIGQLRPAYSELGGPWYQYEDSYWRPGPPGSNGGIDWAGEQESKPEYALNLLLGHHGILSLSPIYLLTVAAVFMLSGALAKRGGASPVDPLEPVGHSPVAAGGVIMPLTTLMTLVITGFYLVKTSNYGGLTSGPRWFMWLTPFWLLTMLPALDWLAPYRGGRNLAYVVLAIAVFSATFPGNNPWKHPWVYQLWQAWVWIDY